MRKVIPRKPRRDPSVIEGEKRFSDAVQKKDWEYAGTAVFWTALRVGGSEGIMRALENANSYVKRRKLSGTGGKKK